MNNKTILIFGGSGSLGTALINRYKSNNHIYNFSRDECKQYELSILYKDQIKNILGDIRDRDKVQLELMRVNPHVIIIAAALKHIERCEDDTDQSIKTNIVGIKNILDATEILQDRLTNLETVVMVSTDKACSPINVYGFCKALAERMTIEKSRISSKVKYVVTRYGNVLNSRGSIIPRLHLMGQQGKEYTLTDTRMTRFVMTLEESVDLIEHAILEARTGHIVIPKIRCMKVESLFKIFGKKYNLPVRVCGLRPGEKLHEDLINESESTRSKFDGKYYSIHPVFQTHFIPGECFVYNSNNVEDMMNAESLQTYLSDLALI